MIKTFVYTKDMMHFLHIEGDLIKASELFLLSFLSAFFGKLSLKLG